ncbi:hypothetical protein BDZ91DRAFT_406433 [Kalaharituber pfeilii]|nr:hypothetical protein BDZ91DRAFT_406433 [Kalaharituber pfeilii]
MLAGFIVFPSAFDDDKSKFRIEADTLRVVAVCLLVLGYILTGILCWRFKNLLFQVESIFLPGFSSSTIGFMSSLFNVYGKTYKNAGDQWSASAILAIVLSSVFMILYGATSLNANRKLDQIRKLDEYRRQLDDSQEDLSLLSEEERTRRNLLNLLLSPQLQQQQQQQHSTRNLSSFFSSSPTNLSSAYAPLPAHHSRLHSYPSTPATAARQNSPSYQMSTHPAYSPPAAGLGIAGIGRNSREGLQQSLPIHESSSRWGIGRSRSSGEGSVATRTTSNTAYVSPSMVPSSTPVSYAGSVSNMQQDSGHGHSVNAGPSYYDEGDKEVVNAPAKRTSVFAGISATVGHGRERVGAGWTSWSPP